MTGEAGKRPSWPLHEDKMFYTPLSFFFCNHPGLYYPLISTQFHDVRLQLELEMKTDLKWKSVDVLANMVFLDEDERKRFASSSHEMLIQQLQYTKAAVKAGSNSITLPFNHPVSHLVWVVKESTQKDGEVYARSNAKLEVVKSAQLRLNHHTRFGRSAPHGSYFRTVVPYEKFAGSTSIDRPIYAFSFALDPCNPVQVTGSTNFSRIDSAVLDLELQGLQENDTYEVCVYAVNWQVLRNTSGMAGVAFSN